MNGIVISFYGSRAAYPISGSVPLLYGKETTVPDASMSLGGIKAASSMYSETYHPLVNSLAPKEVPWNGPDYLYRLFRDITPAEASAGVTLYRGFYVSAGTPLVDLTVGLDAAPAVGTLTFGTETPLTYDGVRSVQRIASEKTAPSGVVFSAYTTASPLHLGTSGLDAEPFLWMKLVIPAGATPTMYDAFKMKFADGFNTFDAVSCHTVQKGITGATVSGALDGSVVVHPYGDTFTISTFDANGAAADPPSSLVMVYAASSFTSAPYMRDLYGLDMSGTTVGQATKVSTGVYKYTFRPTVPGSYLLTFDCGGELQATRNVEVSPVP